MPLPLLIQRVIEHYLDNVEKNQRKYISLPQHVIPFVTFPNKARRTKLHDEGHKDNMKCLMKIFVCFFLS